MQRLAWWIFALCASLSAQEASWKFAVSGDSRNCGDVVMPAIASGVRQGGAQFYWHLGDFRAIYTFDEDLVPPAALGLPAPAKPLNIAGYLGSAWPDFIARQLVPFGDLPVYLGIGNHETIPPATRQDYLTQFADWLATPELRAQRLRDDPTDHQLRTYYHWVRQGVDFINLDNASHDQFDSAQLKWFHAVVQRDEASSQIRTIVVGMHAALPGSFGYSHSMGDWAEGEKTGREVYEALLNAQNIAHKRVYVLASHSHFFMENVFQTDYWRGKVLPGWIVGTAGAVRYALPDKSYSDYGYLLGSAAADGAITFTFQPVRLEDLLQANHSRLPEALVRWCFQNNKQ